MALLLLSASLGAPAGVSSQPWAHSWDTAGQAWWGDFGYSLLNDEQATFIADNYFMASLEKCTGRGQGLATEQGIYLTAKQLKAKNPAVKTVFYWHTGQAGIGCFGAAQRHPPPTFICAPMKWQGCGAWCAGTVLACPPPPLHSPPFPFPPPPPHCWSCALASPSWIRPSARSSP